MKTSRAPRSSTRRCKPPSPKNDIFRIDHYLGKETVQNLIYFRFANSIYEPLWNRLYIDHVQITVAEQVGVEARGGYYDHAGAARDMLQNHLFQLFTLTAMEPPASLDAESIRDEKVKVLRSIPTPSLEFLQANTVRAQYGGGYINDKAIPAYRQEEKVAHNSLTETFVAARFEIDNWRWHGVSLLSPYRQGAGGRVHGNQHRLQAPPSVLFAASSDDRLRRNTLRIRIQPNEGISIKFNAKVPARPRRRRSTWPSPTGAISIITCPKPMNGSSSMRLSANRPSSPAPTKSKRPGVWSIRSRTPGPSRMRAICPSTPAVRWGRWSPSCSWKRRAVIGSDRRNPRREPEEASFCRSLVAGLLLLGCTPLLRAQDAAPPEDNDRSPYHLALLDYKVGKFQEALDALEPAGATAPSGQDPKVVILQSRILTELKRYDEGESCCGPGSSRPGPLEIQIALGDLLLRKRSFDRAAKYYALALQAKQDDPDITLKLIYAKIGISDLVDAGQLASHLMPIDPKNPYDDHASYYSPRRPSRRRPAKTRKRRTTSKMPAPTMASRSPTVTSKPTSRFLPRLRNPPASDLTPPPLLKNSPPK